MDDYDESGEDQDDLMVVRDSKFELKKRKKQLDNYESILMKNKKSVSF